MSVNDFHLIDARSGVQTLPWQVASGTANSIKAGEPTKQSGTAAVYAALLADADGVIGTMQPLIGVGAKLSTDTATADGSVDLALFLPGMIWETQAKSSTAADTQSEINAMVGDLYIVDVTTGKFTMDTANGTVSTAPFLIVGGNPDTSSVWFMTRSDGTIFGRATV